jgi:phage N-6-adenine-methyltransferase
MSNPRHGWKTPNYIVERCWNVLHGLHAVRGSGFTLDVAASAENAKAPCFYTEEEDSLNRSWSGHVVWCNPPYRKIGDWVDKCVDERVPTGLLVPSSTGSAWFRDAAENCVAWYLFRGRIRFEPPEGVKSSTPDIDNAYFVFNTVQVRPPHFGGFLESGPGKDIFAHAMTPVCTFTPLSVRQFGAKVL